jgi:hypothetical protein
MGMERVAKPGEAKESFVRVFLRWFICLLLLCMASVAFAEDKEFEAEGRAKIFAKDTTKAHDEALTNALKELIKVGSAFILGEENYKKNEKEVAKRVLATYKRYINWHGVSAESYTDTEAIVKVKASLSLDKLRADLAPLLTTATTEKPLSKKILLLRAPIAPEEFAKPVDQRNPAPTVAQLPEQVTKPLKEMGYEVTDGGSIGPVDTFVAIGERAKSANASMAIVMSPVGGVVGAVSVVKVSCAQISVRLFFIALDGSDLGKLEFVSTQCDASSDNALRLAGDTSLSKVSSMLRKDNRLNTTARKRIKVAGIPSFAALENVQKQLQGAAGKGIELLGIDGGVAVFSIPAGNTAAEVASRVSTLLGTSASTKIEDGVPVVRLSYHKIFAEGITDDKMLGFLFDAISVLPTVTQGSAPPLPNTDGTAEIWLWTPQSAQDLAAAISAQTLFGRTLTATVKSDGSIRLVVGGSKLGEKKEIKLP